MLLFQKLQTPTGQLWHDPGWQDGHEKQTRVGGFAGIHGPEIQCHFQCESVSIDPSRLSVILCLLDKGFMS